MAEPAKILLVDDDPVFVAATKMVLESKYTMVTAYDGDEGLLKARIEKPDLILLDIIMPTKDGFHVCKQFKEDSKLVKIPVSAGLELEAEGYIDKPISPDELLKQVRVILNKK
jgi:DNA-binding response OmpR family regulator